MSEAVPQYHKWTAMNEQSPATSRNSKRTSTFLPRIDALAKRIGLWGAAILVVVALATQLLPHWLVFVAAAFFGWSVVSIIRAMRGTLSLSGATDPFFYLTLFVVSLLALCWAGLHYAVTILVQFMDVLHGGDRMPRSSIWKPLLALGLVSFAAVSWGFVFTASLLARCSGALSQAVDVEDASL